METGGNVPGDEDAADSHADTLRHKRAYANWGATGRRERERGCGLKRRLRKGMCEGASGLWSTINSTGTRIGCQGTVTMEKNNPNL